MTVSARPPTSSRNTPAGTIGRIVLAVVLAFVFWAWVTNSDDPDRERDFPNMPVTTTNLPPTLSIVSMMPNTVTIAIWGPRSVVTTATLTADSFKAVVDLQNAKAGTQSYPVRVMDTVQGVRKRETIPPTVQVTLEQTTQKSLPVTVQTSMQTGIQVRSTTANPSQVTVSGPAGQVNKVAQVVANLDLGGHTTSFSAPVDLKAVDANGMVVSEVSFDTPRVTVMADIADLGNERTVFVNANITGSPASGFQNTNVVITPPQVTLVGDQQQIRSIPNVSTQPVNIDGFQQTTALDVPLAPLPGGVTIKGGITTVNVQVVITERTQDEKFSVPVTFVNCRAGLRCAATPTDTTVTLRGTRQALDAIRNRVTVQADFSPFTMPTTPQPVGLTVLLPSDSQVVVVDQPSPPMVQATVTAAPTATPMPLTATPVPPTATVVPPSATPLPPTATPVPPTATRPPPTATPFPPTATAAP